jgi:hypothetical protein
MLSARVRDSSTALGMTKLRVNILVLHLQHQIATSRLCRSLVAFIGLLCQAPQLSNGVSQKRPTIKRPGVLVSPCDDA